MSTEFRSALYAILASIAAIVVSYGLITQDQAALWLALAANVLTAVGLIIARRYVPTADDYTPQRSAP